MKQNYRDRVEAEIPHERNTKAFISGYQRAITKVTQNMNEEELEEAENMVKQWNQEGAPLELQQRYLLKFDIVQYKLYNLFRNAKRKLPNEISKAVQNWKFSSGALVMCLVAYPDGAGGLQSFQ